MTSTLVLGATGYIGSAFVAALQQEFPQSTVTALVRNPLHAKILKDSGISVTFGNLDDLNTVVDLASKADIVVNAAVSDNIPLIHAILAGQKSHQCNGKKAVLIHLSRSAFSLHREGSSALGLRTECIDDINTDEWMNEESNDMARLVDDEILHTLDDPTLAAFIIAPATVFGDAYTRFPRGSHQIRGLVQCALRMRHVIIPGDGMNVRNGIHLQDLVKLMLQIVRLAGQDRSSRLDEAVGFFFASGAEFYWGDIASFVANKLYSKGLLDSPTVSSCRLSEFPWMREYALNGGIQSLRGRMLEWSPNMELSIGLNLDQDVERIVDDLKKAPSAA